MFDDSIYVRLWTLKELLQVIWVSLYSLEPVTQGYHRAYLWQTIPISPSDLTGTYLDTNTQRCSIRTTLSLFLIIFWKNNLNCFFLPDINRQSRISRYCSNNVLLQCNCNIYPFLFWLMLSHPYLIRLRKWCLQYFDIHIHFDSKTISQRPSVRTNLSRKCNHIDDLYNNDHIHL